MNRLAITNYETNDKLFTAYIALDDKREFIDFALYGQDTSLLDEIYIGRVEKIVPNIQAAFVRIAPEIVCYLPLSEVDEAIFTRRHSEKKPICLEDELIVQVTRDSVKTKNPVVSTRLTLTGSYSVLVTMPQTLCVSKKLSMEQREKKRAFLEVLCADHKEEGYGIVLRTNSMQASEEEITEDVLGLVEQYRRIRQKEIHLTAFTRLYRNPPGYIRRLQTIRQFSAQIGRETQGYDAVVTDNPEIYRQIAKHLPYLAENHILQMYEDPQVSLSVLYHIKGNIERLLSRQVWLSSGANLVIDTVEAMTVIDVNTAKNIQGKNDSVILKVNLEAAREIARQLRLRNISGIILVDFINMKTADAQRELITVLREELAQDTVCCNFIDITKLGLVEITRKKVYRSLAESLNGNSTKTK